MFGEREENYVIRLGHVAFECVKRTCLVDSWVYQPGARERGMGWRYNYGSHHDAVGTYSYKTG